MEELSRLMAAHGVEAWLRETNSLAALVDPEGRVIECNPAFSRLGGGGRLGTLADPESRAALEDLRRAALQSGAIRRGAVSLLTAQGRTSYDASLIPLPGGLTIFLAEARLQNGEALGEDVARLMQENARMQQKLNAKQIEIDAVITQAHEVSHTDELTLIFNRRQIIADLQREVAYAERYDTPLSISMVDVDHFKRVNDS